MSEHYLEQPSSDCPDGVHWARELAPLVAAKHIIAQPQGGLDTRSDWYWIRLPSGDLVLATYPRGDTYEYTEQYRTI